VAAGKLPESYRIPQRYRSNHPQALRRALAADGLLGALPFYPLGTDLTDTEAELAVALEYLAQLQGDTRALLVHARAGWRTPADPGLQAALARLGLDAPRGIAQRFYRSLVTRALLQEVRDSGRPLFADDAENR